MLVRQMKWRRWLVAACAPAILCPVTACVAGDPVRRVVVTPDNRKIVVHDKTGRVAFYARVDAATPSVEIPLRGQRAVIGDQGRYVAVVGRGIGVAAPLAVYDSAGRRVGGFTTPKSWTVRRVSNTGPLLILVRTGPHMPPTIARLVDANGKLLADFSDMKNYEHVQLAFDTDGTPYAWGRDDKTKRLFLSVLDKSGRTVGTCWLQPQGQERVRLEQDRIRQVVGNAKAGVLAAYLHGAFPAGERYLRDRRVVIWSVRDGKKRVVDFSDVPLRPISPISLSPDAKTLAVALGSHSLALLSTSDGKVLVKTAAAPKLGTLACRRIWKMRCLDGGRVVLVGWWGQGKGTLLGKVSMERSGAFGPVVSLGQFGTGGPEVQIRPGGDVALTRGATVALSRGAK